MRLVDVYNRQNAIGELYQILKDRLKEPGTNISHTKMPTMEDHARFFHGNPYVGWYFIMVDGDILGSCYITYDDEIGIYIKPQCRSRGFAKTAVKMLMQKHKAPRYYANVNPLNENSARLFKSLGGTLIQHTYAMEDTNGNT